MRKILAIIFISSCAYSSTFFAPDSDTALLVELVTTTVSQLNELERLVSNTEKYTQKMQEYNELVQDHYYRALRVQYLVEDLSMMGDQKIKDLGVLNQAIRTFKYNMEDFRELMFEYGIRVKKDESLQRVSFNDESQIKRDNKLADIQIKRASEIRSVKGATRLNVQTNTLANKNLVGIKNKTNQLVHLKAESNQMLMEEKGQKLMQEKHKRDFYKFTPYIHRKLGMGIE